jgi:hypothetical protein
MRYCSALLMLDGCAINGLSLVDVLYTDRSAPLNR